MADQNPYKSTVCDNCGDSVSDYELRITHRESVRHNDVVDWCINCKPKDKQKIESCPIERPHIDVDNRGGDNARDEL